MKKDEFRNFIKSIILEVKKEKTDSADTEKKDKSSNYLDSTKSKYKSDVTPDIKDTAEGLLPRITRIVRRIDKNASVVADDHNDITAILSGMFRIRISPRGAGLYNVEAYRDMSDRVYAIALSKEQVIDFVKVNFSVKKKGYVQTAYDKSLGHLKDDSKKRSKELPKGEPVKNREVPDKDVEDAVTDKKDLPDAPMSPTENPKRQEEYAAAKPKNMAKAVAMSKRDVDDTLVIGKKDFGDTSKMGKKV